MDYNGNNRDRIWCFQRRNYWDARYKQRLVAQADVFNERKFDWLCTYDLVRAHVDAYLTGAALALDIGCGNADFAAAICAAHPLLHITGVDYSSSLFDSCGTTLGPNHRTDWLNMDARAMALRDHSFDVVLDKGCLDALCAGHDHIALLRAWGREVTSEEERLSHAAVASVMQLFREVERCLVPGGRWDLITSALSQLPGRQGGNIRGLCVGCMLAILIHLSRHRSATSCSVTAQPLGARNA